MPYKSFMRIEFLASCLWVGGYFMEIQCFLPMLKCLQAKLIKIEN